MGHGGDLGLEGTFVRDYARVVHPVLGDSPLLIACILHVRLHMGVRGWERVR